MFICTLINFISVQKYMRSKSNSDVDILVIITIMVVIIMQRRAPPLWGPACYRPAHRWPPIGIPPLLMYLCLCHNVLNSTICISIIRYSILCLNPTNMQYVQWHTITTPQCWQPIIIYCWWCSHIVLGWPMLPVPFVFCWQASQD